MNASFHRSNIRSSIPLADVLDALLWSAMLWLAFDVLLRRVPYAALLALIPALLGGAGVLLWLKQKSKTRAAAAFQQKRSELILNRILLLSAKEAEVLFAPDTVLQKFHASTDDFLSLLRSGVKEVWLCGTAEENARTLLSDKIILHDSEETANRFQNLVTDEEVRMALRQEPKRHPVRFWGKLLLLWKPNRFTLLGMALTVLSFFAVYRIWMRVFASLCFLLGALLQTRKQLSRIINRT